MQALDVVVYLFIYLLLIKAGFFICAYHCLPLKAGVESPALELGKTGL